MQIDSKQVSSKQVYNLMTQTIVPRPIAWVLSDNGDSSYNLAPFSYFNGVTSDPPILSISIGYKKDGSPKDSRKNIEERKQFVVHIPSADAIDAIIRSSAPLPFGVSEIEDCALPLTQETGWPLPRLECAQVALLCEHHQTIEVGNKRQGLVLGEIISFYFDDTIVQQSDPNLEIALDQINPLARLGGSDYSEIKILKTS